MYSLELFCFTLVTVAYFRKTGLERSESFTKDIEWLSQQNIQIPDPQSPSAKYVKYLEELAVKNAPFFFCHLYNIYFSHIAGGQVILKKVCSLLLLTSNSCLRISSCGSLLIG